MDILVFNPKVDIPLCLVTIALFIWHFNRWAASGTIDSPVKLMKRLPAARVRVTLLFAVSFAACWYCNFAFWAIYVLVCCFGLIFSIVAGDASGPNMFWMFTVTLIREWAFGFPQLILHPPQDNDTKMVSMPKSEFDGQSAITISPLRPCGEIRINGKKISAISDDGRLIDKDEEVVVLGKRNGQLSVKVVDADQPKVSD